MRRILKILFVTLLFIGANYIGLAPYNITNATSKSNESSHNQTIDRTVKLATQGKAINSEQFGLGSKKKKILKKWGKPQYEDAYTLDYKKRHVTFTISKGRVTKVTTTDKRILALTHEDVHNALGEPIDHDQGAGQVYETYQAGKNLIQIHWTDVTDNGKLKLVDLSVVKK